MVSALCPGPMVSELAASASLVVYSSTREECTKKRVYAPHA